MKRTRGRGVERRGNGKVGGKGAEWMGEAQTGRFSRVDGRGGGRGVSKPAVEEESHSRAAFAR